MAKNEEIRRLKREQAKLLERQREKQFELERKKMAENAKRFEEKERERDALRRQLALEKAEKEKQH